jgi:putative FmdB family regulatory protein
LTLTLGDTLNHHQLLLYWIITMPIYEYKCADCGETREVNIKHSEYEKYEVMCSNGHYLPMIRVYTAPGIKFNGPGFYSTGG